MGASGATHLIPYQRILNPTRATRGARMADGFRQLRPVARPILAADIDTAHLHRRRYRK